MIEKNRVIGRERESALLDQGVGPGDDGLRLSLLSGPSGLGKTTLLSGLIDRARERGYRVALGRGRAGALSVPFAPFIEALPELSALLETTAGPGGSHDMEQVGIALVALLAELSVDQPLVLAFDDVQALDESSLALLPYAAGVSERMNLSLVFVEQSDAIDIPSSYRSFIDGLLARRIVHHVELGPMSDDSIRMLIAHVLDIEHEADVPAEIVVRAQGNPWFAQELAAAFQQGNSEIPTSIASVATSRLHSLEDAAQDLAYAIALCPEGAHIGWLEVLSGERPRNFVRLIEGIYSSGLIREDGDLVDIAHPLMRQAVIDELSAAMKRAMHLEIAEAVGQTPLGEVAVARAQGFHLSQAGKTDEAVEYFIRAAEANEVVGQLHEAAVDYVRALDVEPRMDRRVSLLKRCAFASMQTGSDRAIEYWSELGRIAAANGDNDTYAFALFQQYWTSYDGTALDRLERAASLGADKYGWAARAAACLSTLSGDDEKAIEHDKRALKLARESEDRMLEVLAVDKLGTNHITSGRLAEGIEYLRQAVSLSMVHRYHGWTLTSWTTLSDALTQNLDPDGAVSETIAALKYVDDFELIRYQPMVRAYNAVALSFRGRVEEAMKIVESILQENIVPSTVGHFDAIISVLAAIVATAEGDVTKCGPIVEAALQVSVDHGYVAYQFEAQFAHARLLAITGDVDGAMAIAHTLEFDGPMIQAEVALWLARLGVAYGRDDAIELTRRYRESLKSEMPLVALMCDEIDYSLQAFKSKDIADLAAIANQWKLSKRDLDAARALTSVAAIHVAAKRPADAIEVYKEARSEFARMGALADADLVTAALRKLGTRSRAKSRSTTVGNLTKRELQIARLVAAGMRNAEVAQQLFLAEKTVAAHLSNIYGKVSVNSRVQLASWLKEHDEEASSVA